MSDNDVRDYGVRKALVNAPIAWQDLRLSEQIHGLRFFRDADNNLVVIPTVLFDPTQTGSNVLPMGRVGISDPGALNSYARVNGLPGAGWSDATLGLVVHATEMLEKIVGAARTLEAQRTPTLFKVASANAAGDNTVWTPAGGKKFRLLGFILTISKDAACAGAQHIDFYDGASRIMFFDISSAALVATGNEIVIPINFGGNGYLSIAADNLFKVNLNGAFTTGMCTVNAWGTEE